MRHALTVIVFFAFLLALRPRLAPITLLFAVPLAPTFWFCLNYASLPDTPQRRLPRRIFAGVVAITVTAATLMIWRFAGTWFR